MGIFAPISKPAAPACTLQLQSRHRCCWIFSCLAATWTNHPSKLTAVQGAIQWQMQAIAAIRGQGSAAGPAHCKGSQARRSPNTHRCTTQTSNITTPTRGTSSHTSQIPSSFCVKRLRSVPKRTAQQDPSLLTKFEHIHVHCWVC